VPGKIYSIQYLRGLAALGVVFCHYGAGISSMFAFGQAGVYVFFMISGFIIVYSLQSEDYKPRDFLRFMLKRSIRIDLPYYAVILLSFLVLYVLSLVPGFHGHTLSFIPGQFLAHLLYVVPFSGYTFYNNVFWTLGVEVQFYLLVGALYFVFRTELWQMLFIILFSLSCKIVLKQGYNLVFTYGPFFAAGMALIPFYKRRTATDAILPLLILAVIYYRFNIGVGLLITAASLIVLYTKVVIKPLYMLGEISYSLYLIHGLVFIIVAGCIKRVDGNFYEHQYIYIYAEVAIAIAAACIFNLLIEKPSQRLSKKVADYLKQKRLQKMEGVKLTGATR
jgi:peptidoglycan/LPS O-acetylase OafA/YrhL